MTALSQRTWSVRVGSTDVSNLDIEFEVMRSTKHEPNTATIHIYNLSEDTRSAIESADSALIRLRAGYGDNPQTLFVGDARRIETVKDGPDLVTAVEGQDGGRAFQQTRLSKAYRPGVRTITVVRDLVDALGVGQGNLDTLVALPLRNRSDSFPDGYAVSGSVQRSLTRLLRGGGYTWSVQNNAVQIKRRGQALQDTAVLLSPTSGLVGSPTKGDRGRVQAVSLIQPGLDPGRRVVLESALVSGGFEIERAEYVGATRGNDWYVALELEPLQ